MDLSEEVRAAHKREFADFLDQDVCLMHSLFSFSVWYFFLVLTFCVESSGGKRHLHGRNQSPNQPQAPPPHCQHLRSPQLPRLG